MLSVTVLTDRRGVYIIVPLVAHLEPQPACRGRERTHSGDRVSSERPETTPHRCGLGGTRRDARSAVGYACAGRVGGGSVGGLERASVADRTIVVRGGTVNSCYVVGQRSDYFLAVPLVYLNAINSNETVGVSVLRSTVELEAHLRLVRDAEPRSITTV